MPGLIYLSHKRFGIFCHCAYGGIVGWYGTPSQHGHIQFLCQGRELRLGLLVVKFIHEEDTSCIFAERRQLDVLLISKLDGIEFMWNGGKDSGAVSGVIVTGTGATMVHRNGKTLGIANYLMGTTTIYGNYETDTTSFLFKLRVVQALFWRTLPRFSHLTTRQVVVVRIFFFVELFPYLCATFNVSYEGDVT
jgi:hypothetical protein